MADLKIDKGTTAVLALGLFKGVVAHNEMARERDIIGKAKRVIEAARGAGIPVVHVVIGFREGYPEVSGRNKLFRQFKENGIFQLGSEQVQIHDDVKPAPGEVVVSRPRVNPFYNSELDTVLRARNAETLVLMGVPTNLIVESTARWASDADYRVVILEDCCAGWRQEDHDMSVKEILPILLDVATSEDFIESVG